VIEQTLSPEREMLAAWARAMTAYDVAAEAAGTLIQPYCCIGGYRWDAPAYVAPLDELLCSLLIPPAPHYSKLGPPPLAKSWTKVRKLERLTAQIVAATQAAQRGE
jgi:hypothetical protein